LEASSLLFNLKNVKQERKLYMSNSISYRQGDVLLIKVEDKDELNDVESTVLAEGEATGHKHEIINGTVHTRKWYSEPKYVRSTGETTLVHPEHGHIKIGKGLFEVRIQREYDELANRYVAD
jgi:hypothetical protein